ncbi:MAG: hypothetical protein H7175_15345, partial [Burkholderiales bacterium]|nr:hypothetical protein [Anaerolineae bacterium]
MSAKRVGAGYILPLLLILVTSACAVSHTAPLTRIALLAPFEGRYREVGYDALYAARLALADDGRGNIDLLAVDDGGTPQNAADHAAALAHDPLVKVVIVLGYDATEADTLRALNDLPVLIVSGWGVEAPAISESVFVLSNASINEELTVPPRTSITDAARLPHPLTGGEVFALQGFIRLSDNLEDVEVISSATLPDDAFSERYLASDQFAPEPGLLATMTYDAMSMALAALDENVNRADVRDRLAEMRYEGLNGTIAFESGFWVAAP